MKILIWLALAAIAPGMASMISCLISGVRRGFRIVTLAPERFTPHQSRAAWLTPARITPIDAHCAASTGVRVGSTVIRVHRFRRIGAAAESTNRLRAFNTPDR